MSKSINTTGEFYFGVFGEKLTAVYSLNELSDRISGKAKSYITSILYLVAKVTDNPKIDDLGKKIGSINALFESFRKAFVIPDSGNLSDDIADDPSIRERCSLVIEHIKTFLHVEIPHHIRIAARIIVERYQNRESICCSQIIRNTPFQGQTTAWRDSSGR